VDLGRDNNWAGREVDWLTSFSFFFFFFLKQANKLEFKPGLNPNTQK
jgi:hypothetical protein